MLLKEFPLPPHSEQLEDPRKFILVLIRKPWLFRISFLGGLIFGSRLFFTRLL